MEELFSVFEKPKSFARFSAVKLGLASPETILQWSHGEVTKPETINYRTLKPEKDGLFCAKIFGPVKDYECLCGKYKRLRHRGVVCEKCGVEVIQSKVRRERLGHIELAAPVVHIWMFRVLPSRLGAVLDMSVKDLEKVIYYESYLVIDPGKTDLAFCELLGEKEYLEAQREFGKSFKVGIGAEGILEAIKSIDFDQLLKKLKKEYQSTSSDAKRKRLAKRLKILSGLLESGNNPEWMILTRIPVLPPDLRPLVPLEGGRFATSDLNDLYRRILNRNNRLKRLIELNAPEIILKNEKRMLQEAVDALFDNSKRSKPVTGSNKRPLKSLSDMLKGKTGRFRQNLLGKRVDYSGRSVIVVGPELRLHQCGLPKQMALELFKPFVYQQLEQKGFVTTIKSAKRLVEKEKPIVWDILEEVIKEHPVMLNRAPTLHRLGIQAFEPLLTESKAIRLHPLVCFAYNADFDGDQMAVHVPISIESMVENRTLIMSTNNVLGPAHGKSILTPTQDIVLGLYYVTRERPFARGSGRIFSNEDEVRIAWELGEVHLQATIKCKIDGKLYDTTVGRALLYSYLPRILPFSKFNRVLKKKDLAKLLDYCFLNYGGKACVILADRLKDLGFYFSTLGAISIGVKDLLIPSNKAELIAEAEQKVKNIELQYQEGLITAGERYSKIIDVWSEVSEKIADELMATVSKQEFKDPSGSSTQVADSFNPVYIMADSGARGSVQQLKQLSGMRGLMAKPDGSIIEQPIISNFREGLNNLEYFLSTHGARKGLADTALKTANAGYLTRRLVDVSHDIMITEIDCGTDNYIIVGSIVESGEEIEPLVDRIVGRVIAEDIYDPVTGQLLVKKNQEITEEIAQQISDSGIDSVRIRSVLVCESKKGVCAKCYGRDLGRGHLVNVGEAVGVIAAQSIGEPGTQLTMRTFHIGGAAIGKVEQSSHQTKLGGIVKFDNIRLVQKKDGTNVVMSRKGQVIIVDPKDGVEKEKFQIVYGARLFVKEGEKIKQGAVIAEWDPFVNPILSELPGKVEWLDLNEFTISERTDERTGLIEKEVVQSKTKAQDLRPRIVVHSSNGDMRVYNLPFGSILVAENGASVDAGDILAKRPKKVMKSGDITGGLPRVVELFEARKPKDSAILSETSGTVDLFEDARGRRIITVKSDDGTTKEYLVPKGKQIIVQKGDRVNAGEQLTDGIPNPHDILDILGVTAVAGYLVEKIKEVYRLQGVSINDKHFEIVVRQMLRRVRIEDAGDSDFIVGDVVLGTTVQEKNAKLIAQKKKPAKFKPVLMGITRASLAFDTSFISAASFQETPRVLTDAACNGKIDYLQGLKENVILGRPIPAGTGLREYRDISITVEGQEVDES
ncbi:MAG: DNA-directed RNA polymerase subunit beta', partial [Deltaproteobacteria bacterium]|nr:DNA-directed RNA polymerase subunit beta' [Deltaproteobacteria bacterium]